MQIPKLEQFIKNPRTIIGVDPGETVGICVMQGSTLCDASQLRCPKVDDNSFLVLKTYFNKWPCDEVVVEDYRVYGWKTDEHSFAGLHTPKLIGMLVTICIIQGIPFTLRMAQPAKAFVTDEKLEAWGLWDRGRRHSRDAMRHCIFQMVFGDKDKSE